MRAQVFDFYDDNGESLKNWIPDGAVIPDFVKTAEQVSRDAHHNQFAVVMLDGDEVSKRYPVSDAGNAWLSSIYFADTHTALPGEAQKVAAAHIKVAMERYGLPVLEIIEKLADGESPMNNVVDITGQSPAARLREPTVQDDGAREDAQFALERADGTKVYPLNSAATAAAADEYFDTHKHDFSFRERREFAVKTAAALDQVGLPASDAVLSYASPGYSPNIQAFIDLRHHYLMDAGDPDSAAVLRKIASERKNIDPETFAQKLEGFDREVGLDAAWDTHVPDPYYSTFFLSRGMQKTANENDTPTKNFSVGADRVSDADLKNLAKNGQALVTQALGDKVCKAFCKEPIEVFCSLPTPTKEVLARLASDLRT